MVKRGESMDKERTPLPLAPLMLLGLLAALAGCQDPYWDNEDMALDQCKDTCESHGGWKQACLNRDGTLRSCHCMDERGRWHCP